MNGIDLKEYTKQRIAEWNRKEAKKKKHFEELFSMFAPKQEKDIPVISKKIIYRREDTRLKTQFAPKQEKDIPVISKKIIYRREDTQQKKYQGITKKVEKWLKKRQTQRRILKKEKQPVVHFKLERRKPIFFG